MTSVEKSSVQGGDEPFIRDCLLTDAGAIAEIYNEQIRSGVSTMITEEKSEATIEALIKGFSERETILVLETAGSLIGWGSIKRYSDRSGYRSCCETSVFLRSDKIRMGYGSRIKLALIERCRAYQYHHLVAKIFAENTGSIEYNLRLGYEVVGRQHEIGYRNGHWQDVIIMQLILDNVPPYRPELG